MPKEERRKSKAEIFVPYEPAMGRVLERFFDNLKNERILGTRCKKCSRVMVPPRGFCPRCFEQTEEWVDVGPEGVIESWSYVAYEYYGMRIKPPFVAGLIRLDGSDTGFLHMIGGFDQSDFNKVRENVKLGGRVKVVWNKEKKGDIFDIAYFELVK